MRCCLYTALALIAVIVSLTGVFLIVNRKYKEAELLNREVHAAAEIYDAMYLIDLTADSIRPIRPSPEVESFLNKDYVNFRSRIAAAVSQLAADESQPVLKSFMDLSTVEDRMRSMWSVSQEYLNRSNQWMRTRFVVVSRNDSGALREILWALESIDEDKRRQEHLKLLAETDSMTKIRNRSSGEALIRQLTADGVDGMFLLMDMNRFKSINDQFGHSVGDQVLIAVAEAVRSSMRRDDIVFRLGGDEFAAYAPGIQSEVTANHILERVLSNVSAISVPGMSGREVHVSVGATFFSSEQGDSFASLYRRADLGMYKSKQRGGNCATYWQENG